MTHFRSSKGITTIQLIIIIAIVIVAIGGAFLFTRPRDKTPPIAVLRSNSTETHEDKPITFSAGESSDNVGIISYNWDFGDGTTGTGENVVHSYSEIGNFTVELTMADKAGNVEKATLTIEVSQAFLSERSTFTITDPNQEYQFNASNGITVYIPKDSVISNTQIIVKNENTSVIDKPQWSQEILEAYNISSDKPLRDNIVLSFPLPDTGLLGLGHFHDGEWELLDFSMEEEKAIVEVKELSLFFLILIDEEVIGTNFEELIMSRYLKEDPICQSNEIEIRDDDLSLEYIKGCYVETSDNEVMVKIYNIAPITLDVFPLPYAEVRYKPIDVYSEDIYGIIIPPNEYGEWIINTDELTQVTFNAYLSQNAFVGFLLDFINLHIPLRKTAQDAIYFVKDGKPFPWDDFFQGILKPIINKIMLGIPKLLDYGTKMIEIYEMESFEFDQLSLDFTRVPSDLFLQVNNGGFEEDYSGEGWGIQGWTSQGNIGITQGYIGRGITLIKSTSHDSYLSQSIDFEVETNVLSFWIKPSPNGYDVTIRCYLDNDILYHETFSGNDFTWENIQVSFETSIGYHELKFIVLSGSEGVVSGSEASVSWSEIPQVFIDEIS